MKKHLLLGIEKISKQLDIEFRYTVANHKFELGLPLENALKRYFLPYFPKRYSFGSGYLVDINEKLSNQSDWIIYDAIHFSPLISKANTEDVIEFYPFDAAYSCIEVKRTLTKETLGKAILQLAQTCSLSRASSDPSYIHPLLSYRAIIQIDVNDILTNHFITAIYAYSQDDTISEDPADICSYVANNFAFKDIPDLIAIHGKLILFKTSCTINSVGVKEYRFSYRPDERNTICCNSSGALTSGYFYTLLLSMLQNTFLNASDFNNSLYSIINDFGVSYFNLGKC